jgi:hypothetical protein
MGAVGPGVLTVSTGCVCFSSRICGSRATDQLRAQLMVARRPFTLRATSAMAVRAGCWPS